VRRKPGRRKVERKVSEAIDIKLDFKKKEIEILNIKPESHL
jgi:hypothetical protein